MSTKTDTTQYLPPLTAQRCAKCGRKVFFKFVASRVQAEGKFRIGYLRCPSCGAKAQRLIEIIPPED